jgi:YD repeat-containing protein
VKSYLSVVSLVLFFVFSANGLPKKEKQILKNGTIVYKVSPGTLINWYGPENLGDVLVGQHVDFRLDWGAANPLIDTTDISITSVTGNVTLLHNDCGSTVYYGGGCSIYYRYAPTSPEQLYATIRMAWHAVYYDSHVENGYHDFVFTGNSFDRPPKCPASAPGSFIDVTAKTVGEAVPLVGIPFDLYYSSAYTPEYSTTTGALTPAFSFNMAGWAISLQHLYLEPQHRLFKGDGTVAARQNMVLSDGNLLVTSGEEDEVYIFSPAGQHLETRTFLTGAIKYTFGYDSNSRLITVTDAYGKVTTITRDSSGYITSITGPFGQTTTISLSGSNLFSAVTNPNSETYSFTYKTGTALLETFTKPGGQVSTFSYDSSGHLTKDEGNGGNFWELTPQTSGTIKASYLGRETSYLSWYNGDGSFSSSETDPAGYQVTRTENLDGSSTADYQTKAITTYTGDDYRFGSIHRRITSTSLTTSGSTMDTNFFQSLQYPDGVPNLLLIS